MYRLWRVVPGYQLLLLYGSVVIDLLVFIRCTIESRVLSDWIDTLLHASLGSPHLDSYRLWMITMIAQTIKNQLHRTLALALGYTTQYVGCLPSQSAVSVLVKAAALAVVVVDTPVALDRRRRLLAMCSK